MNKVGEGKMITGTASEFAGRWCKVMLPEGYIPDTSWCGLHFFWEEGSIASVRIIPDPFLKEKLNLLVTSENPKTLRLPYEPTAHFDSVLGNVLKRYLEMLELPSNTILTAVFPKQREIPWYVDHWRHEDAMDVVKGMGVEPNEENIQFIKSLIIEELINIDRKSFRLYEALEETELFDEDSDNFDDEDDDE